jgi:hypothetical protein
MEPAAGKRPQEEQEAGGGGEEGVGAGHAEEPGPKRAKPECPEGAEGGESGGFAAEDEEGMVTEESQGDESIESSEGNEQEGDEKHPRFSGEQLRGRWEWFQEQCAFELPYCPACLNTDRREEPCQRLPELARCFCNESEAHPHPHRRQSFSWENILNDVPLQDLDLKTAVQAMDGQWYWNGKKEEVFRFGRAVVNEQTGEQEHTIEQILESYLNLDKWQWRTRQKIPHKVSDEERQELAELTKKATEKAGAQGMQGIAAIRAWTEEHLDLYRVVTSVAQRATSKQCLGKILPYLRLLYEGLCLLPEEYVFSGEIYRGEKFIRRAFQRYLEPGQPTEFKVFTSFTTNAKVAGDFMHESFFYEFMPIDDGNVLVSANPIFTLEERLRSFFNRYACDECRNEWNCQCAAEIADLFEHNEADLHEKLVRRFKKPLEQPEKPERTVIVVQDGVGYRLKNLSVIPEEQEVLMEPGARLQVVEDSRQEWKRFGESDSKRLRLKTVTCHGLSVLTKKDGQDFTSLAKEKERAVVEERLQIDALKALHREKRTGGCLSNLAPEILSQLQKIRECLAQSPSTSKAGLGTRSATRGGRGLSDVRGLVMSEDQKAQTLIKQLWEEAHDFDGACDWLLQVTVKQHDGKDDEVGERIDASKVQTVKDLRRYSVDAGQLPKVTVRNLSLVRTISFTPIYVDETGNDDPEEAIMLKSGESQELPIPLEKSSGENDYGWDLRDGEGTKTLLRLRFRCSTAN